MMRFNSTTNHYSQWPTDDRPDYLKGDMYLLAVDTETTGLDWSGGDYPFIATASDYDSDYLFQLVEHPDGMGHDANGKWHDIKELQAAIDKAEGLIFHNAPFDVHMLVSHGICEIESLLAKPIYDTNILSRLVLNEPNYQLKSLSAKYIDSDAGQYEEVIRQCMVSMDLIRKETQKDVGAGSYYEVWKAYRHEMEQYALYDTRYTYDLYNLLLSKATFDQIRCFDIEMAVQPTLIRMEHLGIKVDSKRIAEIADRLETKELNHLENLHTLNGGEFDPGKDASLIAFFEKNGVVLDQLTKTGKIATSQWVLEKHKDVPAVAAVLDYRSTNKVLTTYARPMIDRDVVHASFWQVGAWTGRMSCSRPNLQNIPIRSEDGREMRSVFVPRPGYVFIDADYSSIELRLLAYYTNSDHLWQVIEGGDPFLWLGTQIYGTEDQNQWPVTRQSLKNGFYALTYGAGGPRLAQTIGGGMTPTEGRELAKRMRTALGAPYEILLKRLKQAVMTRGYVRTLGGRTQWIPKDKSYVALNALIQGSAADIMKVGLARAEFRLGDIGGRPLLVVHDEILAEVPTGRPTFVIQDYLMTLQSAMESAADLAPDGKLVLQTSGVICEHDWSEAK